ncbi:hypothetical protein STEG23_026224 [Scotinomys teguina]
MKRRLAKEKDLPAVRGHLTKSCPVEEAFSVEEDKGVERGASSGQEHSTGRLRPQKKSSPAEEGRSVEWGNRVEKRSSIDDDCPTGRAGIRKKSRPAEESPSFQWGTSGERRPSTDEDRPAGRGHPTKSCPVEEANSVAGDNSVERGASSGQDHHKGRLRPRKKSSPAEQGLSVEWGNCVEPKSSTDEDCPTLGRKVALLRRFHQSFGLPLGREDPLQMKIILQGELCLERKVALERRVHHSNGVPVRREEPLFFLRRKIALQKRVTHLSSVPLQRGYPLLGMMASQEQVGPGIKAVVLRNIYLLREVALPENDVLQRNVNPRIGFTL